MQNVCYTVRFINLFVYNYSDYFPSTITYEAFTEDVNKWPKKLEEGNIPIPWKDDSTDKIKSEMDKMKGEMIKKITDELEKLRQKLVGGN